MDQATTEPPNQPTNPKSMVPPGRSIIADCGSESYASAEYIDHFLAPLAKQHKSYLKDTNAFINKIAGIKEKEGSFIATIDVESL